MRIVLIMLVVLMLASTALANQVQPAQQPASQAEVSSLRLEIAELRTALAALQTTQPERTFSIGVMPIENAGRIPEVGNAFRQVIVSALREAGIQAQESLDSETLRWVQRQDQLVRERWIDPRSAPPRGELKGVSHYLLGTITRYSEEDVEDIRVLAGIIVVRFGGGARIRTGSLVVDFRIVDARTGVSLDSFRTEARVRRKEFGGAVVDGFLGGYRRQEPLPEQAARACAQQAAERLAGQLPAGQLVPPPAPPAPSVPATSSK